VEMVGLLMKKAWAKLSKLFYCLFPERIQTSKGYHMVIALNRVFKLDE